MLRAQGSGGPRLLLTRDCPTTERLFFPSAPQLHSSSPRMEAVLGPQNPTAVDTRALLYTFLERLFMAFTRPIQVQVQCPGLGRGARYPRNVLLQGHSCLLYNSGLSLMGVSDFQLGILMSSCHNI